MLPTGAALLISLQAVLLNWTKGFSASGCVGQDVVQMLREAAQRKQVGKSWGICPLSPVVPPWWWGGVPAGDTRQSRQCC